MSTTHNSETPAVLSRLKSRLSDLPKKRTVNQIMQPKIDELMQFAAEQGFLIEDVMELMGQRCQKKAKTTKVEIPIKDSLGFFNSTHSSRSWTELRLFLLKFGVELPTRHHCILPSTFRRSRAMSSIKI